MARKTFISYKYSEAVDLRENILKKLGEDAKYYRGENSDSPDLSDYKTDAIKSKLKNMIWGTSVTIVIASPNMRESKWMEWEISYSLKQISRDDTTSKTNGVVVVVMKDEKDSYDWLIEHHTGKDGCSYISHKTNKLFNIITENRFNRKSPEYICAKCKTIDELKGSYISIIKEDAFLNNPQKYIENAYDKSQNLNDFNIKKEV